MIATLFSRFGRMFSWREGEVYPQYFLRGLLTITNLSVKGFLFKMGVLTHTMPITVRVKDYLCKSLNSA